MPKLTLSEEAHSLIKKAATQKGTSMSEFVSKLVKDVGVTDKDIKVILTIPTTLAKKNRESLENWLAVRAKSIVKSFYPD